MKYLLAIFILTPCAASSQITNVHEVATSTNSITQTMSLCASGGAANIASLTSSGTLSGSFAIEAYNPIASTNTINCGFDQALSSAILNGWYGRELPAGVGVYWAIPSNKILRCITQNSSGCTRVTVTQFK